MELMIEIRKDKTALRIGRIVFLFCIVFLMLLAQLFYGQSVNRVSFDDNGKSIIKRYTKTAISLKNPLGGEGILLSAYSDSLDVKTITFAIYINFPKNVNPDVSGLVVKYTDGTQDVFHQTVLDRSDNYAEYEAIDNINNISTKKVYSILLRGVALYNISNKTYFKDFFAGL
jgi:hypothetical protein